MKHTAERMRCLEQRQAVLPLYTPQAAPQKYHVVTWLPLTKVSLPPLVYYASEILSLKNTSIHEAKQMQISEKQIKQNKAICKAKK